jgi:hypothetical protein
MVRQNNALKLYASDSNQRRIGSEASDDFSDELQGSKIYTHRVALQKLDTIVFYPLIALIGTHI